MDYHNLLSETNDNMKLLLIEKDRIISLQEKDICSLKREIQSLRNQLECFQSEKE